LFDYWRFVDQVEAKRAGGSVAPLKR